MKLQGRNLTNGTRGDDVRLLHHELSLLGFRDIPESEVRSGVFGRQTFTAVRAFQEKARLEVTGIVDEITARALSERLDRLAGDGNGATSTGEDADSYVVQGKVTSPDSAGVGGLTVAILDKGVGRDVELTKAVTNERGEYEARFEAALFRERRKEKPDLQALVYAGDELLASSEVRYNATPRETLHVRLPARAKALASEHETLTGALARHFDGGLADLEETEERQDISYLAHKSGWDARAVAMASQAERLGRQADIPPAFYYALFRAGLPADAETLHQAGAGTVRGIWKRALDQGVIPRELENRLPRVVESFQSQAARQALDSRAAAGTSSLREMLELTFRDDRERQERFAELYARHREDPEKLWTAVRQELGPEAADRLQVDGQLGFLTLNNAPLIERLHRSGSGPLSSTRELVDRGLYRAESWEELVGDAVPAEIPGGTIAEKRANYAGLLASQVRLSFPTAVLAERVRGGELRLDAEAREGVAELLSKNQGRFEIGLQPIDRFLAKNQMEDQVAEPVKREIRRLQRVYQITPDDQAMRVLLDDDLDSAYRIVRYEQAEFVQSYKDRLGEENAKLIHAKSQQVHMAVLNIATGYLISRTAPALGLNRDELVLTPRPKPPEDFSDVIAYPTLEKLFGSMDYCACDHCRSILSPAAYLVDLLLFIDRPVNERENPQAVLLDRRPDLQHLPLTCENTNTPLPYIDVVNETLEYFITHNLSLAGYKGHDTEDDLTAEELLANPQFVNDAAYNALKAEFFPPPLPFHKPLETLRRSFEKLEAPLPVAMEALRKDDAVERADAASYGWRDILMETLKLSRTEHRLLTDRTLTLQQIFGLPPGTTEADALKQLAKARAFARRVGITYEEVVELLRTRFLNPHAWLLPRLERLHVPFATLKALKDGDLTEEEFEDLLPEGLDLAQYDGDVAAWVQADERYDRIMGLITLSNPTQNRDLCTFEALEFRYSHPDDDANTLRAVDFVRLLRFLRLWKKLGLSIEQTDQLITALSPELPAGDPLERLDDLFLALLPRIGVVFQLIDGLKLSLKRDLPGLLACWSPLGTHGPESLYRKMFLSPALLELDDAFAEDGFGNVLNNPGEKLLEHTEALRAAFGLTGEEMAVIAKELGFDDETPLSLENVSAVYRRGWLARKLRLSVKELLLLIRFTGLDPFAPPDPPDPPVRRLLRLVQDLRAAGLKPVQALYLLWNEDLSGRSAPEERRITDLARSLRAGFATVEGELTVPEAPDLQTARARMAQVYEAAAADFFFGLLEGTLQLEVAPYDHPQETLEPAILAAARGRIAYDDLRKRLAFSGALDVATREALKNVAGVSNGFKAAVDDLYGRSEEETGRFFARYPELRPLYTAYAASNEAPEERRRELLEALLPNLRARRKRQQALAAVSAAMRFDPLFAQAVLDDAAVLHAAADPARPALDDLAALETPGLGAPVADVWSGFLEAPENGFYNLAIEADAGAAVTLALGGKPIALAQDGQVWSNADPIELSAGLLFPIELKATAGAPVLRWRTEGRGWEEVPARHLYSAVLVDRLRGAAVRLLKAASLAAALKMTPRETAHLAARAGLHIDGRGWLNALPVEGSPDAPTAEALRDRLSTLLGFARLKSELSPDDERLLQVLEDPEAVLANGESLLLTVTGWEEGSLAELLGRFGRARADLADVSVFRRVHEAYAVVKTLGVPAAALAGSVTNEPGAETVRALQSALRARYDESDWLAVIKPINDALRGRQRDALVASVLRRLGEREESRHIDTPDKLFEYFLMDVQMEPCMQTSRIRHALSSVQLFIERCLMNLEPRVAPSSIRARLWEWMKRYRVWEANRKVFLWPENWLEPELRDDQSPIFKETMSELLESDITEDRAATALLNYLAKLDEVAKLEPCGIYFQENDPGTADDVVHAVARSSGAHRKYYYRRRKGGSWSPWEPIKLDIEDNPVMPVVWNGRLLLFWVKILKQGPDELKKPGQDPQKPGQENVALAGLKTGDIKADAAEVTIQAVLCWSERYNGKWQPARTSDLERPLELGRFDAAGKDAFNRSRLRLAALEEGQGEKKVLRISLRNEGGGSFILHNTHSLPEAQNGIGGTPWRRDCDTNAATLTLYYAQAGGGHQPPLVRTVLENGLVDGTAEPRHVLKSSWTAPFFFADTRHVFYVTSRERTLSRLQDHLDFGWKPFRPGWKDEIPNIVFERPPLRVPPKGDPWEKRPGLDFFDTLPIEQFVTEDVHIHNGLGTGGSFRLDGREIGASGLLKAGARGEI
jgi:hypothetical protein